MNVSKEYRSPHFKDENISVEFAVLHYTAQSLQASLNIFLNKKSKPVSCHLLIDEKGKIYELVDCWGGSCKKAFHAGQSFFKDSKGRLWKDFNNISLGIELVNLNGNFIKFTEEQYQSLRDVFSHLKNLYPSLQNPERVLGHEHIAGFRGKKDPGSLFDWSYFFQNVYPNQKYVQRVSVLTKKQVQSLSFLKNYLNGNDKKARQVSILMEKKIRAFWLYKILIWFIVKFF